MGDRRERQPVAIPGMCDQGPPSYEITPEENLLNLREVRELIRDRDALHCVHHGTIREVLTGRETLYKAELSVETADEKTHLEHIHEVPEGTLQINQNLWNRRIDAETGRVLVRENEDESVWGIGYFLLPRKNGTVDPMTREEISEIADEILVERSRKRDFSNKQALAAAMELVRTVILINQCAIHEESWLEDTDDPEWEAEHTVKARALETLDIVYNYNRIVMAGIDLEQHPEYHSYQPFYELGWKPPSHQRMADHIIQIPA